MLTPPAAIEAHDSPELDALAACTELLDLGEYRIFEAAYRAWFGREPSDADLKPGFAGYLRGLRLPLWVRHYCRQVIAEAEAEGRLRPCAAPPPPRFALECRLHGDVALATVLGTLMLTLLAIA